MKDIREESGLNINLIATVYLVTKIYHVNNYVLCTIQLLIRMVFYVDTHYRTLIKGL